MTKLNFTFFLFLLISFTMQAQQISESNNVSPLSKKTSEKPNILWIYIEDMNPFLGCFGDSTVATPNMDKLAEEGVLFTQCMVPAAVCSPTRSAIISGRMQTTIGAHNHNSAYNKETPVYLPDYLQGNTLPEIFRANGYSTFNQGKDHYNFTFDREQLYTMQRVANRIAPWRELKDKNKPFFGQVQVSGGKFVFGKNPEVNTIKNKTSFEAAAKTLPPYYPKDDVFLKHWALHYDCVLLTDIYVGNIIESLKEDGLLENTIVICFSDHGCYMPRHKQFCYEGGLHVPFIVSAPNKYAKQSPGTVRNELINALDISATSLSFAGIQIPEWYDSKDLFEKNYERKFVVSAKDRMDFTIDRIRSLRTNDKMRYIRNYFSERPYMQLNYRHGREYMVRMDSLFKAGALSETEARFWSDYRPTEELYDLNNDPFEINNLANNPNYKTTLLKLRKELDNWVKETDDKGQYPEDVPNLRHTYEMWGDEKCINPEYDQFRIEK